MSFLWPDLLWLLLLAPLLVAFYVWLLKRRKPVAVRYSNLALVKAAIGPGQRVKRHIPPALLLAGLVAMLIGLARPTALVTLPNHHQTIVLAVDVSLSMRATDVDPSRITAAQAAVRSFVEEMPPNLKVALVAFAGTAALVQPATHNREDLVAAIDRLQLARATATGSALVVSLNALFPEDPIDLEQFVFGRSGGGTSRSLPGANEPRAEKKAPKAPVPPGSFKQGAIVLLSDGRRTTGPDPVDVAKIAADRGVRVYTVGFGTLEGGQIGFEGWSIYVRLDEEALKNVARITEGQYYYAGSAQDLKKVYQGLSDRFVLERTETEVTALFSALAALLVFLAAALSFLWFNRGLAAGRPGVSGPQQSRAA